MQQENGVYTAIDLCDKIIPEMRWVVKDFLGEGITLLSGRPKGGKTLLAEQLGIAVATGGLFLGRYETVKGAVLYVNVDDPNERRLQENLRLLGGRVEGLSFMSALPELDAGGLEILDQELARMANIDPCKLLVLDTLTALRREQSGKNLVKADYDFVTLIKGLEAKHGCSVLLISHTRKDSTSSERVDSIDSHLGTTGITAAVDATMVLTGADDTKKVLKAKGRDISPFEVHLELQVDDRSGWVAVDAPVEPEKKKELGDLRRRILDAVRAIGPCGPDAVHKQVGGVAATIRSSLKRMVGDGQLCRNANSLYTLPLLQHCNTATDATAGGLDARCTVAVLQTPTPVALTEPDHPAPVSPVSLFHPLQVPPAVSPAPAEPAVPAAFKNQTVQPPASKPLPMPAIEPTEPAAAPALELSVEDRIFAMLAAAAVNGRDVSLVAFRRDLGLGRDETTAELNMMVRAKKILEAGQENGRSYRLPRVDRRAA